MCLQKGPLSGEIASFGRKDTFRCANSSISYIPALCRLATKPITIEPLFLCHSFCDINFPWEMQRRLVTSSFFLSSSSQVRTNRRCIFLRQGRWWAWAEEGVRPRRRAPSGWLTGRSPSPSRYLLRRERDGEGEKRQQDGAGGQPVNQTTGKGHDHENDVTQKEKWGRQVKSAL